MSGRIVSWTLSWTSADGTETETREFNSLLALIAKQYALLLTKGGTATVSPTPTA